MPMKLAATRLVVLLVLPILVPGHVSGALVRTATDAQQLFQEASRLQNEGNFSAALTKWREFLTNYPTDPSLGQAYGGLGVCLLETGDYSKAVGAFDEALKRLPKSEAGESLRWNRAIACYRRAEQSKLASDYQEALQALRFIAEGTDFSKRRRALANFYLAKIEQSQGKVDAAKNRFGSLLAAGADSSVVPPALLALAGLAEEAKDWPTALGHYEQFLRDYPKHAAADDARLGMADVFFTTQRLAEAERLYGELRHQAQFASADYAQYRWAEIAYLRGKYQIAAKRFSQFLDERPKSAYRAAALFAAGEAQVQLKDFSAAVRTFEQLLREFPDHPDARRAKLRLAQSIYDAGEPARAEAAAERLIAELRDAHQRAAALVLFARCAAKLQHPAEAVRRFESYFQTNVKSDESDQIRCEAAAQAFAAGDSERGLNWTAELIQQAPRSDPASQAQLHAARWLAENGKFDQALERSRWVLDAKIESAQPLALYLSGYCSMKLRQFDNAAKYYANLLESYPHYDQAAAACFSLGVAYESLGAKSKAIDAYAKMAKSYPNDPLTRKARERIATLQNDG
jgi:TolA-binding protein